MNVTIKQNNGAIEEVNSTIIDTLYDLAFDNNNSVLLEGRLHSTHGHENKANNLTTMYNNLFITIDNKYITFLDEDLEKVMATSYGDGVGVTIVQASAVRTLVNNLGSENLPESVRNTVTSFNELVYFTGITKINEWVFHNCRNLQSIDLSGCNNTITQLGQFCLDGMPNLTTLHIDSFPAVISIPSNLFFGDINLEGSFSFPSVTGDFPTNNYGAWFGNCLKITKLSFGHPTCIASGAESLPEKRCGFYNMKALRTLDCGDSIQKWGNLNFWGDISSLQAIIMNVSTPPLVVVRNDKNIIISNSDISTLITPYKWCGNSNTILFVPDAAVSTFLNDPIFGTLGNNRIKGISEYEQGVLNGIYI